jgi:hypothetical protein
MQIDENRLVKTEAVAATCVKDGCKAYYTDPLTGKIYADENGTQETSLAALKEPAHGLTSVPAKDATSESDGNIAYWYCPICGKYFADGEAVEEISKEDTVIPATGTVSGKQGDADGDGSVDAYDAALVVQFSIGSITEDSLNIAALDVDGDGYVDAFDAVLILKYCVGAITKFPTQG